MSELMFKYVGCIFAANYLFMKVDAVKCCQFKLRCNLKRSGYSHRSGADNQSDLISRINSLLYKFGNTDSQVLMKLFVSKCCHFYGCESWNFNQAVLERIMHDNMEQGCQAYIYGLAAGQQDHASCWAKSGQTCLGNHFQYGPKQDSPRRSFV